MKVLTADGRMRAVAGPAAAAASNAWADFVPAAGSVRLVDGPGGIGRSVRLNGIYKTNPWVFGVVRRKAASVSRVPIHVFETLDGGDRRRVPPDRSDPAGLLADVLLHPGSRTSGRRLRRKVTTDLNVHANAFAEIVRDRSQVTGLTWHPWADLDWELSTDGLTVDVWRVPTRRNRWGGVAAGDWRLLAPDDVVHFTVGDDLEGPFGVSPLGPLSATHRLYDASMRWIVAYFRNSTSSPLHLELPAGTTADGAAMARQMILDAHGSPENAGRVLATTGKPTPLSASPETSRIVELIAQSKEEVEAAYEVRLDLSRTNRAAAVVIREQFLRDVVGHDVAVLETELDAQLLPAMRAWAGLTIEGQLAEQLRPDLQARAQVYAISKHWMTPNEQRRLENMPASDDPRADQLIFDPGTPELQELDPDANAPADDGD